MECIPGAPASKQFGVDKVLEKRVSACGKAEYLLKWLGYSESENSWEPAENICPTILTEFEKAQQSQPKTFQEEEPRVEEQMPGSHASAASVLPPTPAPPKVVGKKLARRNKKKNKTVCERLAMRQKKEIKQVSSFQTRLT